MRGSLLGIILFFCWSPALFAGEPEVLASNLSHPASVCYGPQGLLYVAEMGEPDKPGDGKVTVVQDGQTRAFATGLDDPEGIVFHQDALYVTDRTKIVRIDQQGKTSTYAGPEMFPYPPVALSDIAVDGGNGIFLVTDAGRDDEAPAVFRIDIRLSKIEVVANQDSIPALVRPHGVVFDGASHCIVADRGIGALYRVRMPDKSASRLAGAVEGATGLVWDDFGRLFITSATTGQTFAIPRPGATPVQLAAQLEEAADGCLERGGNRLIVPDIEAGKLVAISTTIPGREIDETPLPVECVLAFPNLTWTGWDDGSETGVVVPLRPILLTHAGDGSNRIYVPLQQGQIHVFENDDNATSTQIFLDISEKVRYKENENEEGLLGLAFHPKFKENGEFFVFYTDENSKLTNVVSRFRVKKDDPTVGDPASEEELLRIEKPYWNHDGGTLAFGPDGYLYLTHGDGGSGGDPQGNGQKLSNLLGKILRIDIDRKSNGKNYAIPDDNPFVNQAGAAPEIWAYGLRNVWRFAFDRETGQLWAADVGQGLFEELDLIKRGGNYGWSNREGLHPFGNKGVGANRNMIEPIWEYHHNLGVSVTGGLVYRGAAIPELTGAYLYGDYVSNRMWALTYDPKLGRVVANRPFKGSGVGIMSFGEDNKGEAYVMGTTATGKSIFRIVKSPASAGE